MSNLEITGYVCAIFIGVVLGLLGGGGSILSIPILVYLFKIDVVMASAYSLFIVGTTSFIGAIPKYKEHLVNIRMGILFGIPSIISIFATRKWIVPEIPDVLWQGDAILITRRIFLLGVFALLMVLASISMIKGGLKPIDATDKKFKPFLVVIEGTLIGLLTGLVGAGGGFLIIPALVLLTGLNFKTAVGTSLFIIAINSLMGFLGDVLNYTMNWSLLLSLTALAIIGILIGNYFTRYASAHVLRKAFGWLILVMGCWILFKELFLSA